MSSKNKKKNSKTENSTSSINNKKAFHDFFIEDKIVAGIVLSGTEVKSIRTGKVQLRDSFAKIEDGEVWLYNCNISQYQYGNRYNHKPDRKRKLLLHKKEILKLFQKVKEKNLALIPLQIFFKNNWAKIELGLAKGKKEYDKRESIKKKEINKNLKEIKNKYVSRK